MRGDMYFWQKITGIEILDPDGWDRKNPESFLEKISLGEFLNKAMISTVSDWKAVDRVERAFYGYSNDEPIGCNYDKTTS